MKVSKQRRELLCSYILGVMEALQLGVYRVAIVVDEAKKSDHWASVSVLTGFEVTLTVHSSLLSQAPEFIRETIAHELVHIMLDSLVTPVEAAFETIYGESGASILSSLEEPVTQKIAVSLSKWLPLPPKELVRRSGRTRAAQKGTGGSQMGQVG